MNTVTLGPRGTYSHRAAQSVGDPIDFRETKTDIVAAIDAGNFERGVLPIENSTGGSVTESLDALADHDVSVLGEIVTPIRHALLAQSSEFDVVASHSQALAQCREYLGEAYPEVTQEAVASTARGVERAREDRSVAGIGHPDNAGDDLEIVAEDIQDSSSNATRFFVLGPASEKREDGGKSSIIVYPNTNYPGLLLELLEPFADRDLNLSRVESRPSGERLGDYIFHLDVEAGLYEQRTKDALAEIEALTYDGWLRWLGSYDVEHVV